MCFDFHYFHSTKSLRIDLGKDFEDILCSQPNQINNKYKKSKIVFFFTGFTAVLFLVTLKIKFKNKRKTINVNRSINKSHILVVLMKSECSKYKCKYFTYFTLCEIRRLTYRSLIFSILPGDVTTSFFSYFSV